MRDKTYTETQIDTVFPDDQFTQIRLLNESTTCELRLAQDQIEYESENSLFRLEQQCLSL